MRAINSAEWSWHASSFKDQKFLFTFAARIREEIPIKQSASGETDKEESMISTKQKAF